MVKPVSDHIFAFEGTGKPALTHERCSAADLGLKEAWLRDAIFENPDLVIGPCRAAGLTEDEWYPWQREHGTPVGPIDVLLLSSGGRVGIVETKLASNPELRRRVLAQALDYLTHLSDQLDEAMPTLPVDTNGNAIADPEDVRESVAQRDMLVIVASDQTDPRVVRLSRGLLGKHLINQWDLALVDVALYRPVGGVPGEHIVVPHLRSLVESEPRQVVRVVVEGETPKARVEVERITHDNVTSVREKWDEIRFFENLEATPKPIRDLAERLRELARRYPGSLDLAWGTGRNGSLTLKRQNGGLVEVYASGKIRFRPPKFARALGEHNGAEYLHQLQQLFPGRITMEYARISPEEAAKVAPCLYELIERTVDHVERKP